MNHTGFQKEKLDQSQRIHLNKGQLKNMTKIANEILIKLLKVMNVNLMKIQLETL